MMAVILNCLDEKKLISSSVTFLFKVAMEEMIPNTDPIMRNKSHHLAKL